MPELNRILPVFAEVGGLPPTSAEMRRTLLSDLIRRIDHYALGPEGTNIMQVAAQFSTAMGIAHKTKVIPCTTPEESVARARSTLVEGVLNVFWTCAVFVRENDIFFSNSDAKPFLFQVEVPLDAMQLACRPDLGPILTSPSGFLGRKIASHPSPAALVRALGAEILIANSNADAAVRCAAGEVVACITTESARRLHGLMTLHTFGSPPMIFFGGACRAGLELLERTFASITNPLGILKSVRNGAA